MLQPADFNRSHLGLLAAYGTLMAAAREKTRVGSGYSILNHSLLFRNQVRNPFSVLVIIQWGLVVTVLVKLPIPATEIAAAKE